jgi:hypothetical protein
MPLESHPFGWLSCFPEPNKTKGAQVQQQGLFQDSDFISAADSICTRGLFDHFTHRVSERIKNTRIGQGVFSKLLRENHEL